MKKKIINGIMMVALVAATSTSFVSCKDTNEDVRVEQAIEIAGLQGRLTTLENQYGDLDGRVSQMKTRLDEVQALAEQNAEDIAVLELNVDAIEEEIGQLELWLIETFAKLVTSVEISGTFNNMTGSINIPGFEPKMLIFNYGVAAKAGSFPKNVNDDIIPIEWVANEEIGAGAFNPGNAGYIYANVNRYLDTPLLTKDQDEDSFFDFKLVNTAGEEVEGVKIGNVDEDGAPTTDVLQWGWTRADNNIFKFAVAYDGDEAKNFEAAKIDLKTLKEDLKAVWRDRNKSTGTSKEALGRLVADLYYKYATADTNLKKYALKIAWMDNTAWKYEKDAEDADDYADIVPSDEKSGMKHMVTSEAELVFAAVKPLGFNSGEVFAEQVGAGIHDINAVVEKSEVLLNKIFDKIKAQIPNFNPITFDLTSGILYDAGANVYYIEFDGVPGYLPFAIVPGPPAAYSGDINITDLIVNMNLNVNNGIAGVNDMLAQLNTLKNKLNASSVTNWIEKFTNKANTLFANHAGQILQPTLLAINNGVVNRVSGVKELPYVAAGEVTLKPTTYTAELFAPCYAKFVGCKDIEEDNFNQILFSGDQELKFTPEAGKLYEIVYEAVDYFGNTFEHTYYIKGGVK